ncbi:MAG: nucleoside triphosphate pyrophosphohydrolase [Candidatus Aminicenantes bacterium]|nr:MAG: nucleoside triphosphate pyrophosphohydrolase [Candidatus Aminicenantes bacterium]
MEDSGIAGEKFARLVEILDVLRSEEGCPWDREQDEKTITNFFLEEVYEAVEALYSQDYASLAEELGDVMMEVVFLARIAREKKKFTISDILEGINNKMIRRHPHVFGNANQKDSARVRQVWNEQKQAEKERESALDGITKSNPALLTAFQVGMRVSSFGFDWSHPMDVLQKVKEEVAELEKAIQRKQEEEIFDEIGDILFSLANLSRHFDVNPEIALREANKKFMRRFQYVEKKIKQEDRDWGQVSLEEMDRIWEEAKEQE